MTSFLTVSEFKQIVPARVLIDVRKDEAYAASGRTIAGALRRPPSQVGEWAADFRGRPVAIFCVHGHEVSQTVCTRLRSEGIDAVYIEGGFEALVTAGFPTEKAQ